jgi:hypothetical protein
MFLFTCGWLPLFLALTVLDNPLLGIKIATEDAKVCLWCLLDTFEVIEKMVYISF